MGIGCRAGVKPAEERVVAIAGSFGDRLADDGSRHVDRRNRGVRVGASHELDVVPQHAGLHVMRIDHVVRHEEELFAAQPVVVLLDDRREFGDAPSGRISLQDQMQHRHEMAFTAAEASVEERRFAGSPLDGAADERQGGVEAPRQLGRDHVITERLLGAIDALG